MSGCEECQYFLRGVDSYDPRGPDGKGRNRLRIEAMPGEGLPRCRLRPVTLRALWESLAGRSPGRTGFRECDAMNAETCERASKVRHPRRYATVRLCSRTGEHWLLNRRDGGWAESGYPANLAHIAALLSGSTDYEFKWGVDEAGEFIEVSAFDAEVAK